MYIDIPYLDVDNLELTQWETARAEIARAHCDPPSLAMSEHWESVFSAHQLIFRLNDPDLRLQAEEHGDDPDEVERKIIEAFGAIVATIKNYDPERAEILETRSCLKK